VQQVDGRLLEHTRAHAVFDIVTTLDLDDNRLDALQVQQVAEHQPGWPRTHDGHLRSHETCSLTLTRLCNLCLVAQPPHFAGWVAW